MTEPPSTVYINGRFLTQPISGVQRYGHELLRAIDHLVDAGDPVAARMRFQLLAPRKGLRHQLTLKHIPVECRGSLQGHLWEQLELPGMVRDGLLFCPGNTAPLRSLRRQPVVVTVHGLSYLFHPEYYSRSFRAVYNLVVPAVLRRAAAVITVSDTERRTIRDRFPVVGERIQAIQLGGFGHRFAPVIARSRAVREPDLLLYVGALNLLKNPQGIIQALVRLAPSHNVRLLIAGGGGKSFDGSELVIPVEVEDRIELLGQIDETERLIELYCRARALVFPSFYETSGLPPLEAMACGCPVIASAIPALEERCGDAAHYCDPHDPDSIADAIRRLLEDDASHAELSRKGLERAARFTWEHCARETLAAIAGVCRSWSR